VDVVHRRMPWVDLTDGRGRRVHLSVDSVPGQLNYRAAVEVIDTLGGVEQYRGWIPVAAVADGERLLAVIEALMTGSDWDPDDPTRWESDHVLKRESAKLDHIRGKRPAGSAFDVPQDPAELGARGCSPAGAGGAEGSGAGACGVQPALGGRYPAGGGRGAGDVPGAGAGAVVDVPADRAHGEVGELGLIQDPPYAAVQRAGTRVEYWANENGHVYRRSVKPGRAAPLLGRWVAGTQKAARREIDAVVAVKLAAGWERVPG
jgi:hypothetical protein